MTMYAGFFYMDWSSGREEMESTFVIFAEAEDPKSAVEDFRRQIVACGDPLVCDAIFLDAIVEVRSPAIVAYRSRRTPPDKYRAVIAKDVVRGDVQAYGWSATDAVDVAGHAIEPFATLGDWFLERVPKTKATALEVHKTAPVLPGKESS